MSQPVFFAKLAELLAGMGDQEPKLGEFERSIVPVFVVGDGTELVPPLHAARTVVGGQVVGGGTGTTHPAFQINATQAGGVAVELVITTVTTSAQFAWRITKTPLTMLTPIPCLPQVEVAPGAHFNSNLGHIDFSTFGANIPRVIVGVNTPDWPPKLLIPEGSSLEIACLQSVAIIQVVADVRNVGESARL